MIFHILKWYLNMARFNFKFSIPKLYVVSTILVLYILYKSVNFILIVNGNDDVSKTKLFPLPQEHDIYKQDRILNQIDYKDENIDNFGLRKMIYLYPGIAEDQTMEEEMKSCNIEHCTFTTDQFLKNKADAVVFKRQHLQDIVNQEKPKGQIWIYYELESASSFKFIGDVFAKRLNSKINFTATYRRDSVLVTPYGKFVPHKSRLISKLKENISGRNFAYGKRKMAAWFVSACRSTNGRMEYVRELQKYIDIDIYGACGHLKCPNSDWSNCYKMLNNDYKFYLSFESSNCVDYITDKLYWNGLNNDVIPIVMGARPQDYASVAPPKSYIHVDDFDSPRDLAQYLKLLDNNDDLYNVYFKWKGTGEFINTKVWCRFCSMLYASDGVKIWYNNFTDWYKPHGVCINPQNDMLWSSWKKSKNILRVSSWMLTS